VVWSGVDVLTSFLPVVRGAVVPVVVVWGVVDRGQELSHFRGQK
jgi:hypothetical protein